MFKEEYGEAAVEVLDILDNTNKADVEKIPTSFIKFLVDNASENYAVNFDHSKPMSELPMQEKTKEILGTIYINWWCTNEQRKKYKKQIEEQEKMSQEKMKEKYDPNKIFENKMQEYEHKEKTDNAKSENIAMVQYKQNILKKIWNKILSFFK